MLTFQIPVSLETPTTIILLQRGTGEVSLSVFLLFDITYNVLLVWVEFQYKVSHFLSYREVQAILKCFINKGFGGGGGENLVSL